MLDIYNKIYLINPYGHFGNDRSRNFFPGAIYQVVSKDFERAALHNWGSKSIAQAG